METAHENGVFLVGAFVDLPSFIWLWRIAAWAMGFTVFTYGLQVVTALSLRLVRGQRPRWVPWVRSLHIALGLVLIALVLLLVTVGIIGTLGHYGSLGHSSHLVAGLGVVTLVLLSGLSATQIHRTSWGRPLHLGLNGILLIALAWVSWTGWQVVQKYLPS